MKKTLSVIIISQFFCTSLWFAGNAVLPDLAEKLALESTFLTHLTSSVQLGFIVGTLVFALFAISDRFSPSKVFFVCSFFAGIFNLCMIIDEITPIFLLIFRFSTGFFLAGIYPVGMKIASDYFQKGLGKSLGFLVGALVLGTAFPHLLKTLSFNFDWRYIIISTSFLAFIGGISILSFVPNGPYRKANQHFKFNQFFKGFANKNFRAAAFGYFGHMWELYTFWAFLPMILKKYNQKHSLPVANISLFSFLIIASGSLACVLAGFVSERIGTKKTATWALSSSCLCCLASPFILENPNFVIVLIFLFFWGMVVVADSPLFSTLVAQNAPEEYKGTSITIVNCIGFAITIISIQTFNFLGNYLDSTSIYGVLAIGPIIGLWQLYQSKRLYNDK